MGIEATSVEAWLTALAGCLLALWLIALGLRRVFAYFGKYGYLASRRPGSGGSMSGVFNEFTRLTQPSIEHVERVQEDAQRIERDDLAGD